MVTPTRTGDTRTGVSLGEATLQCVQVAYRYIGVTHESDQSAAEQ